MRCSAFATSLVGALLAFPAFAEGATAGGPALDVRPIVVLVDVSGSMADDDGTGRIKLDGAKSALLDFLTALEPGTLIALRTYPSLSQGDCGSGTGSPLAEIDTGSISSTVRGLTPDGDTPTAEAIRAAAVDLRDAGYDRGSLVLVSDGESTCEDPCVAAKEVAQSGFDLQAITVGFRISDEGRDELQCIADATNDGAYFDVDDGAALTEALAEISRPALELTLAYPPEVVAEVGSDASGLVRISATVRNTTQQTARNVVARLRFDTNLAPGVTRPVRWLGNLGAQEARELTWSFRPGLLLVDKTVALAVIARADNVLRDTVAEARIKVVDRSRREDGGPLIRDREYLAILGDSYSSGEGAGDYERVPGAPSHMRQLCHRSRDTYLVPEFSGARILACSGAVTNDIESAKSKWIAAQVDQLEKAQSVNPVDVVALTLGGNDASFGHLAFACLFKATDCSATINTGFLKAETSQIYMDTRLTNDLADALTDAYDWINWKLNTSERVRDRGALAPILVLAYPLPIPLTGRTCAPLGNQLTVAEMRFIGQFLIRLNGLIEGAVRAAREELGVPVFFVSNTEDAFQPDHTVCDGEPFVRALNSYSGRHTELVHPNKDGYRAMTSAIVRWSLGPEAKAAEAYLAKAIPADDPHPSRQVFSTTDLGSLQGGSAQTLQGGTSYPLTVGGFDPGSPVEIVVRSAVRVLGQEIADRTGTVHARVALPRALDGGDHTIEVTGSSNGKARTVRIPIDVDDPWPTPIRALAAGSAGLGLLAAALWAFVAIRLAWTRRRAAVTR